MRVKKDTVDISSLNYIEEPATACMWLKIKTQDTTMIMTAWYRQWEHPEQINPFKIMGLMLRWRELKAFRDKLKKLKTYQATSTYPGI